MFGYRHTHTDSACITSMSSSAYIHVRNNNIDFRYILHYCIVSKQRHAHAACHKSWSEFQMSYVEVFIVLNDIGDIVDQNYLIFLFIKYRWHHLT